MRQKTQQFRKSTRKGYMGKISDPRRKTKAFSCTPAEWLVFEKFAAYARSQERSESRQIVIIIREFFARMELIDDLNKGVSEPEKSSRVANFPKGSENQGSEIENVKDTIYNSEKMNSLGGGLPAKPEHTCYGMGGDLSNNLK